MNRIQLFILCSAFATMVDAQDFIPLRIDSSYAFFRSFDFVGNPIEVASFEGFTYDEEGQLVQSRRENERSNFTYPPSAEVEFIEVFSEGLWIANKRITTTFSNNLPIEILTETNSDDFFENSQLVTIQYNDNDQELTKLTQFWIDNEWRNQELIENTYDLAGNRILQSYSNSDQDGNFIFIFGDRIKYNSNKQPIEILALTGNGNGGIFFSDKFTISYNNNTLQDTTVFCVYNFPDTVNCQNLSRSILSYDQEENRMIRNLESWNSNEWVSSGRIEEYVGRNIYSALPDSILTFDFSLPTEDKLISRQYFKYFDMNEVEVRYEESLFIYQFEIGEFVLENYREEFYHTESIVSNRDLHLREKMTLFPNPVGKHQILSIKNEGLEFGYLEVEIFDLMGQLIRKESIGSSHEFLSPDDPGIYFIQIKTPENILGIEKIIVQ